MLSFDQCRGSIAPIISGCDGPRERISAFVDRLIQPSGDDTSFVFICLYGRLYVCLFTLQNISIEHFRRISVSDGRGKTLAVRT